MVADFFTKPLQGELFRSFRKVIMGWMPISHLGKENIRQDKKTKTNMMPSSNKERAGKQVIFDYKIMKDEKGKQSTYAEVLKKNIYGNIANVAEKEKYEE